jgi:hypothetical protein
MTNNAVVTARQKPGATERWLRSREADWNNLPEHAEILVSAGELKQFLMHMQRYMSALRTIRRLKNMPDSQMARLADIDETFTSEDA